MKKNELEKLCKVNLPQLTEEAQKKLFLGLRKSLEDEVVHQLSMLGGDIDENSVHTNEDVRELARKYSVDQQYMQEFIRNHRNDIERRKNRVFVVHRKILSETESRLDLLRKFDSAIESGDLTLAELIKKQLEIKEAVIPSRSLVELNEIVGDHTDRLDPAGRTGAGPVTQVNLQVNTGPSKAEVAEQMLKDAIEKRRSEENKVVDV